MSDAIPHQSFHSGTGQADRRTHQDCSAKPREAEPARSGFTRYCSHYIFLYRRSVGENVLNVNVSECIFCHYQLFFRLFLFDVFDYGVRNILRIEKGVIVYWLRNKVKIISLILYPMLSWMHDQGKTHTDDEKEVSASCSSFA